MKHRPHKLPHRSGGHRPWWARSTIWTDANFALWSFHGFPGKVLQRATRQARVAVREAKLPLRARLLKGLGRAWRWRLAAPRKGGERGTVR